MKSISVLFDTNVIIDFLETRGIFAEASGRLFRMCLDGTIKGHIAAQSISDIFYILRKDYTTTQRRSLLRGICGVLDVAGVEKRHVLSALSDNRFSDLEDGIISKCAEDYGFDFVASRNAEDFAASKIPALTPLALVEHLRKEKREQS
jgi:predicted nucleic acid-binding protein